MPAESRSIISHRSQVAGQTVFHYHVHLIPRYKGAIKIIANWLQKPLTDEAKEELVNLLKA